jgi:hypothetical protein
MWKKAYFEEQTRYAERVQVLFKELNQRVTEQKEKFDEDKKKVCIPFNLIL